MYACVPDPLKCCAHVKGAALLMSSDGTLAYCSEALKTAGAAHDCVDVLGLQKLCGESIKYHRVDWDALMPRVHAHQDVGTLTVEMVPKCGSCMQPMKAVIGTRGRVMLFFICPGVYNLKTKLIDDDSEPTGKREVADSGVCVLCLRVCIQVACVPVFDSLQIE